MGEVLGEEDEEASALWWTTDNYVTGLWEKYAYHYGREGVLINSSVAHVDYVKWVSERLKFAGISK